MVMLSSLGGKLMDGDACTPPLAMRLYSRLLHAFPVVRSGLTQLSFNFVTNRQFARCAGPIVARTLDGLEISVPPDDYHGRILYLFGTNDPKVQCTARELLCDGDVFLDIGANYSTIGLAAAGRVGPRGRVHLFEPQEAICRSVERAIGRAGLRNVEIHRVALLDRDDRMTLSRPSQHSGMATLVDYGGDRTGWESQEVSVCNIATYLPPLVGNRPFGVKIDVEGAEPLLMPWLLRQPRLRFMIFEAAHNQGQLWELVHAAGLRMFGLCRSVFRSRIRAVESAGQMSAYHDLVAIRLPGRLEVREASPKEFGRFLRSVGSEEEAPASA